MEFCKSNVTVGRDYHGCGLKPDHKGYHICVGISWCGVTWKDQSAVDSEGSAPTKTASENSNEGEAK